MQNNFTTACISEKITLTKYYRPYDSILSPVFTIIKIWSIFFRPAFISISIVDLKSYASGLHQCQRLQDISTLNFSTINFQPPFLQRSLNICDDFELSWRIFSSTRLVTFFHSAWNRKLAENEPKFWFCFLNNHFSKLGLKMMYYNL